MTPPLDDHAYEPQHPPVNGRVPDVVARWGPRTQVRWFRRHRRQLHAEFPDGLIPTAYPLHIDSARHTGPCCGTCDWETATTGADPMDGSVCCCRAHA